MSKYEFELAGCSGKASFNNFLLAKKIRDKRRKVGCIYKCQFCGKWHIGIPRKNRN